MSSHLHPSTRAHQFSLVYKAQNHVAEARRMSLGNRPENPSPLIISICMCISRASIKPHRYASRATYKNPKKKPPNPQNHTSCSVVRRDHQRLALSLSFAFSLSSHSILLISCSANLTQTSAISLPTLQVLSVTPFRSITAFDRAQRCCHKNSFLPMPSPGLAGMPSSLQAALSRFLRADVVKEERVALLPTRRGGGGGARGRLLVEEGSKAGSKFDCCCCCCCILLGGFP
jgi:hypothetical protein